MLIIVGDGVLMDGLKTQVKELGIGNNVKFLGWRYDIPEILSVSDVFVLPSVTECFPITILEAMSVGIPVVATKVGGVPEEVSDGETGLLVPSENPIALAQAITALLDNPELAQNMGKAGREKALQRFGRGTMIKKHEELYEQLAERKNVNGINSIRNRNSTRQHLAPYELIQWAGRVLIGGVILSGLILLVKLGLNVIGVDISPEIIGALIKAVGVLTLIKSGTLVLKAISFHKSLDEVSDIKIRAGPGLSGKILSLLSKPRLPIPSAISNLFIRKRPISTINLHKNLISEITSQIVSGEAKLKEIKNPEDGEQIAYYDEDEDVITYMATRKSNGELIPIVARYSPLLQYEVYYKELKQKQTGSEFKSYLKTILFARIKYLLSYFISYTPLHRVEADVTITRSQRQDQEISDSNQPGVAIVIPNYRGYLGEGSDTKRCLDSLRELKYKNFEIILVDIEGEGESPYYTAEELHKDFPSAKEVTLMKVSENIGVTGTRNLALRYAIDRESDRKIDYVLSIDNDSKFVDLELIEELLKHAERPAADFDSEAKGIAVVGPAIVYHNEEGKLTGKIQSIGFEFGHKAAPRRIIAKLWPGVSLDTSGPRKVDALLGCCMLLRVDALKEIGVFNDSYFYCYEEEELAFRAHKKGYIFVNVPDAEISHLGQAEHEKNFGTNANRAYFETRNRLLTIRSGVMGFWSILYFMHELVIDSGKIIISFLRNDRLVSSAFIKGLIDGLFGRGTEVIVNVSGKDKT